MAELDAEILERVARWCAEAGRPTGAGEIRAALEPLSWDELLAVRALLADPAPARPLGPLALADLARGAPADVVAEREREGRYRHEPEPGEAPAPAKGERVRGPRTRAKRPAEIVVRRARDRIAPPAEAPPPLPSVSALLEPEGRAVLERLVRRHGARRGRILAELATGWQRDGGGPPEESDLAALLEEHGLASAFERRERDELLHALRAAGGVRARAAAALGLAPDAYEATLDRLAARDDGERIREDRRSELRGRATLTDRVHLFLEDPDRLADLGLLDEIAKDLSTRLREHVRALRTGTEPVRSAFGRSLSLAPDPVSMLEARFDLALGAPAQWAPSPRLDRRSMPGRAERPRGPGGSDRRERRPDRAGGRGARRDAPPDRAGDRGTRRDAPDRAGGRGTRRDAPDRAGDRGTRRDAPDRAGGRGTRRDAPDRAGGRGTRRDAPDRTPSARPGRPPPDRPRSDRSSAPPPGRRRSPPSKPAPREGAERSGRPVRGAPPRGGRSRPGGGRRPR